jgi:hypothetical protein
MVPAPTQKSALIGESATMIIPWILLAVVVIGVIILMATKVLCWCPNSISAKVVKTAVDASKVTTTAVSPTK